MSRHCPPNEVDELYIHLKKQRMSNTRLASLLGISRTTLHLMFNHELPMRRVYGLAIKYTLAANELSNG